MSENTQQTETKKVCAILLDTKSIQKYIFSSNKLKLNIAASYLVRTIFDEIMPEVLKGTDLKMPKTEWNKSERIEMATDKSIECEIAYAGGGNMLILVNKGTESEEKAVRSIGCGQHSVIRLRSRRRGSAPTPRIRRRPA